MQMGKSRLGKIQWNDRWMGYLTAALLACNFFVLVHNLGVTVGDDKTIILFNRMTFGDMMRVIIGEFPVFVRGRIIGQPLAIFLNYLQCAGGALLWFRLFGFIGVLFAVYMFYRFIRSCFSAQAALCCALLFGMFAQIYFKEFSGFTSFGIVYQAAIGFGFLALEQLCRYFDDAKSRHLWFCGLWYFVACSCYESLAAFCLPLLFIAIFKLKEAGALQFKKLLQVLVIPAACGALFLIFFAIGSRASQVVDYVGVTVDGGVTIATFSQALVYMLFGNSPLFLSFANGAAALKYDFAHLLDFSFQNIALWLLAIMAAIVLVRCLYTVPKMRAKTGVFSAAVCILTAGALCAPLALTTLYLNFVVISHVTNIGISYMAYFFLILALFLLLVILVQKSMRFRKMVSVLLVIVLAFSGYLTFSSNYYFRNKANDKYYLFNELAQTDYFLDHVQDGDTIYMYQFDDYYTDVDYVHDIVLRESGRDVQLRYDIEMPIPQTGNTFFIKQNWETGTLVMMQLDGEHQTNEVYLLFTDYHSGKALVVEYGPGFLESMAFPLDGKLHKDMESVRVTPLSNGRTEVLLRTREPHDFRFTRAL